MIKRERKIGMKNPKIMTIDELLAAIRVVRERLTDVAKDLDELTAEIAERHAHAFGEDKV